MAKKSDGGMWISTSTKDANLKYINGKIAINGVTYGFVAFKNDYKDLANPDDKSPNYKIYLKEERSFEAKQEQEQASAEEFVPF